MNKLPEGEKEDDIEKQTDVEHEGEEGEREEEAQGKGFCASCCGCGVTLFEKYYKYFTHHVYIQVLFY